MLTGEITSCCKKLRLSSHIAEMSEKIQAENNQQYLLALLKSEIEYRESARKDKLLKNAGFYTIKSFEDFNFDEITLPETVTVEYLKNLEFLKSKTNIVMYGNVGTGYDKYLVM
ncbi:MAG: ATP-binding protein [Candidatus Humimicrobiaceae bacterium]